MLSSVVPFVEWLQSAGSGSKRWSCSCCFPPCKRRIGMVYPYSHPNDENLRGGGVKTIQWKGRLAAPATSGVCVRRVLKSTFVPTRAVDLYLPSKSSEWKYSHQDSWRRGYLLHSGSVSLPIILSISKCHCKVLLSWVTDCAWNGDLPFLTLSGPRSFDHPF